MVFVVALVNGAVFILSIVVVVVVVVAAVVVVGVAVVVAAVADTAADDAAAAAAAAAAPAAPAPAPETIFIPASWLRGQPTSREGVFLFLVHISHLFPMNHLLAQYKH